MFWRSLASYFICSMFALIPRSGYYSGAALGVRFIALLHPILRLRSDAPCFNVSDGDGEY